MNEFIEERNSFLDTIVNFAIVLRTDFKTIEEIKMFLAQFESVYVVYQKFSLNKLVIKEYGDANE